jgi:hypothetical protein
MSDSQQLKNTVEFRPKYLQEVAKRAGCSTYYSSNVM